MDITLRYTLIASIIIHISLLKLVFLPSQRKMIRIDFPIEIVRIPPMPQVEKAEEEKKVVIPIKKIVKKREPEKKQKEKPEKETKKTTTKPMSAKPLTSSKFLLETSKFPHSWYIRQIRNIIDSNWDYSKASGSARAIVYFRILPDGSIIKLKIDESSGSKIFDFLVKRAVGLSSLPPLPSGYREDYLGVYIEFVYRE